MIYQNYAAHCPLAEVCILYTHCFGSWLFSCLQVAGCHFIDRFFEIWGFHGGISLDINMSNITWNKNA